MTKKHDFIRLLLAIVVAIAVVWICYYFKPQTGLVTRVAYLPLTANLATLQPDQVNLLTDGGAAKVSSNNKMGTIRVFMPVKDNKVTVAFKQAVAEAKNKAAQVGGNTIILTIPPQVRGWVGGGQVLWLVGEVFHQ